MRWYYVLFAFLRCTALASIADDFSEDEREYLYEWATKIDLPPRPKNERIIFLEELLRDPDQPRTNILARIREEIPQTDFTPEIVDTMYLGILTSVRVPERFHEFLMASVGDFDEIHRHKIVSQILAGLGRPATEVQGRLTRQIYVWSKYCILPLRENPLIDPPPCRRSPSGNRWTLTRDSFERFLNDLMLGERQI